MKPDFLNGIDTFLHYRQAYGNKRLALVTNNAAITAKGQLSRVALLAAGFNVVRLFSPEHGIHRTGADGVAQDNDLDEITGLPVTSLYGSGLKPSRQDLEGIDLMLFDIPDIGCRFYTYLWTMTYVMEACADNNLPLIVLDRPNPIGALLAKAEGPTLDEKYCSSFIGRWAIPLKHSCTLGELALYFAATRLPALDLEVVRAENYSRDYTALNEFIFVPTSPAMQDVHTAMLYPGMGLLEGINVNEGRGTREPFRVCGAPFISGEKLRDACATSTISGVKIESHAYVPTEGLYKNERCEGVRFMVIDPLVLQPVTLGISLLRALFSLYPEHIQMRLYKTAANPGGAGHLDKLLGLHGSFDLLRNNADIPTDVKHSWAAVIAPYLLY
ncbi:DUF1343 domain-containing protein [Flavihumibacter sp. R14]|nr:DUF1343 domain-containing protein [Flavihumibacter soli]